LHLFNPFLNFGSRFYQKNVKFKAKKIQYQILKLTVAASKRFVIMVKLNN